MGATAPSRPVVVKVGGRALDSDAARAELACALRALEAPAVLVHGGGAEVSAWSRRLGLAPRFVDGRRVTDRATLEVAVAVLAGLANKRWVAELRAADLDAVGLAALDGGMVEVAPHHRAAELGEVGAIARVQPALLEALLESGRLPVLASIGAHRGRLLNLNADDLAAALAVGLEARALLLLSDVPGVMRSGAVLNCLTLDEASEAVAHGEITGGMKAKLEAAAVAVASGVPQVRVAAWSGVHTLEALLSGAGVGTAVRSAEACDV